MKDTRKILSKVANKNRDNIKLLISDSDFKAIILEVRTHLEIPSEGCPDDDSVRKWSDGLIKKSDKVIGSKEFVQKEVDLRKQCTEKKFSYTDTKEAFDKLYDEIPINYLTNRINFIIDKFYLPLNYKDFLRHYIITNRITVPAQNFGIGPWPEFTKISEARFVPVTIYSRLTDEEVELLKDEVKLFSKRLPKYKPLKNIDRDLEIEEWFNNQERYDTVEDTTYVTTTREIAENLLGNAGEASKIHDIAKDLKNTRKRRFGSSGKT